MYFFSCSRQKHYIKYKIVSIQCVNRFNKLPDQVNGLIMNKVLREAQTAGMVIRVEETSASDRGGSELDVYIRIHGNNKSDDR